MSRRAYNLIVASGLIVGVVTYAIAWALALTGDYVSAFGVLAATACIWFSVLDDKWREAVIGPDEHVS